MGRIKQTFIILLVVLMAGSLTAGAVEERSWGHGHVMHEDNGNGNNGVNNGQGNAGTPGYDNQQTGDHPGEHMGSEYTRVPV